MQNNKPVTTAQSIINTLASGGTVSAQDWATLHSPVYKANARKVWAWIEKTAAVLYYPNSGGVKVGDYIK